MKKKSTVLWLSLMIVLLSYSPLSASASSNFPYEAGDQFKLTYYSIQSVYLNFTEFPLLPYEHSTELQLTVRSVTSADELKDTTIRVTVTSANESNEYETTPVSWLDKVNYWQQFASVLTLGVFVFDPDNYHFDPSYTTASSTANFGEFPPTIDAFATADSDYYKDLESQFTPAETTETTSNGVTASVVRNENTAQYLGDDNYFTYHYAYGLQRAGTTTHGDHWERSCVITIDVKIDVERGFVVKFLTEISDVIIIGNGIWKFYVKQGWVEGDVKESPFFFLPVLVTLVSVIVLRRKQK